MDHDVNVSGAVPNPRGDDIECEGPPGARDVRRVARRAVVLVRRRLAGYTPRGLVPQDWTSSGAATQ